MRTKSFIEYVDSPLMNYQNVSPEEVAAYYKSLGDWQNLLTKTDYTYSPASVYYKKKINGIYPVIPNMSRLSLWAYECGKNTTEKFGCISFEERERELLYSRYTLDDTNIVPKWMLGGKRSTTQSSMFMHFFFLSLFIVFVLFSLRNFSLHF